ncbi:hypothetical protein FQA39_LY05065 [Lamprigera yunnana]|nr:hypothetical protein FQA39_LY05065 [Lamprigera yunnana]
MIEARKRCNKAMTLRDNLVINGEEWKEEELMGNEDEITRIKKNREENKEENKKRERSTDDEGEKFHRGGALKKKNWMQTAGTPRKRKEGEYRGLTYAGGGKFKRSTTQYHRNITTPIQPKKLNEGSQTETMMTTNTKQEQVKVVRKNDQLKANFINFNIMQPNEYVAELNSEKMEKKHRRFMPSCRHESGCRQSDAFGKSVK